MSLNKHSLTDLEYLSELAHTDTPLLQKDLDQLNLRIKKRVNSHKLIHSILKFSILLFIGITVFFSVYNKQTIHPSLYQRSIESESSEPSHVRPEHSISLELPLVTKNHIKDKFEAPLRQQIQYDSIINLNSLSYTQLNSEDSLSDRDILYSPNASIKYLHDLKIANYNAYYFEFKRKVNIGNGVPANLSGDGSTSPRDESLNRFYYLHEAIDEAMNYYKQQKFKQCLLTLNTISEYSPNDVNCLFYKGMCYFQLKQYIDSYTYLKLAYEHPINVFREEAQFYMACSAYRGENKERGYVILKQIAEGKGFYSVKAQLTLQAAN